MPISHGVLQHAVRGHDLHLMYSPIGDRRTLTHEAKDVFDYEDQEHATTTLLVFVYFVVQ